jgi:hypothetical protein
MANQEMAVEAINITFGSSVMVEVITSSGRRIITSKPTPNGAPVLNSETDAMQLAKSIRDLILRNL